MTKNQSSLQKNGPARQILAGRPIPLSLLPYLRPLAGEKQSNISSEVPKS